MNCEEIEELIGAYALGALPVETLAAVGEHLDSCVNHAEAADFRTVASTLVFAAPEIAPPAALKTRLMAAVRDEASQPTKGPQPGGLFGWLKRVTPQRAVPYALAGALAVAIAALILTNTGGSDSPDRAVITLAGAGDASVVLHELEDGVVVMEAAGLQPLADDQTYQVWAIRSGQPESLGLLGTAPEGDALGAMRADLSGIDAVAVTVEPADGSSAPTTEPILQTEDLPSR